MWLVVTELSSIAIETLTILLLNCYTMIFLLINFSGQNIGLGSPYELSFLILMTII